MTLNYASRITLPFMFWRCLFFGLLGALFVSISLLPSDVADIKLPSVFSNNMIFQRGQKNLLYGWATPRVKVQVKVADYALATRAREDGFWQVEIPATNAGGPYTLTIDAVRHKVLKNIVFGDVWLCFGQSNMSMPLSRCEQSEADIAQADFPLIRFFRVPERQSIKLLNDSDGAWCVVTPLTVGKNSGCAYYFARDLYVHSKVPVGIISCGMIGSPLNEWLSEDVIGKPKKLLNGHAADIFNGMVAPLVGYGVKGMVWYQGEANLFNVTDYKKFLPRMIADYRGKWKQPGFSVLLVQLPNYAEHDAQPAESLWAEFREAQWTIVQLLTDAHMIVTIDTAHGASVGLHPKEKRLIGSRLAAAALALDGDRKSGTASPQFESLAINGAKVLVHFDCHGKKLVCKESTVKGFSLAGADRKYYSAQATIQGNGTDVLVFSPAVLNPVTIRYAWADNPVCNLYSTLDLPVAPFRTDTQETAPANRTYRKMELKPYDND